MGSPRKIRTDSEEGNLRRKGDSSKLSVKGWEKQFTEEEKDEKDLYFHDVSGSVLRGCLCKRVRGEAEGRCL
jgi:hypothetical protein